MKETDIAWSAGFFEGEGSIQMDVFNALSVRATQLDREPLDRLQRLWGGDVRFFPGENAHGWILRCKNALPFLHATKAHFGTTHLQEEAEAYIEFYKTSGHDPRLELLKRFVVSRVLYYRKIGKKNYKQE